MPRYADTSGRTREAAPLTEPAFTVTGWPTLQDVCRGFFFAPPATGDVEPRPASARRKNELTAGIVVRLWELDKPAGI